MENLNGFRKYTITNEVLLAQSVSLRWYCWQVSVSILKNFYVYTARSMSMLTCAFLFTQKESCNQRLRSLNHLCVSVKENSQCEMNLSVVPWFEENLCATAFHHLCEKLWGACPETAAFWWLRQAKVSVHSSCLVLAYLIKLFPYGAEWEKLVVD